MDKQAILRKLRDEGMGEFADVFQQPGVYDENGRFNLNVAVSEMGVTRSDFLAMLEKCRQIILADSGEQ